MIDASVEIDVVLDDLIELGPAVVERDAAEAAPVKRDRAAAVRDDQFECREILEQVGHNQLHEGHRIGIEIIGAGRMHGRIAAAGNVNHRRHVELDHFFVERIPPFVGQGRRVEIAA
jgi:hypothetical protein